MRRTFVLDPYRARLVVAIGDREETVNRIARRCGLPSPRETMAAGIVMECHLPRVPRWMVILREPVTTNTLCHEAVHAAWMILSYMDSEFDLMESELHETLAYHSGQIAERLEIALKDYRRSKRLILAVKR